MLSCAELLHSNNSFTIKIENKSKYGPPQAVNWGLQRECALSPLQTDPHKCNFRRMKTVKTSENISGK